MSLIAKASYTEGKPDKKLDGMKRELRDAEVAFKNEIIKISEEKQKDARCMAEDYDMLGQEYGTHQRADLEQIIEDRYNERNQEHYKKQKEAYEEFTKKKETIRSQMEKHVGREIKITHVSLIAAPKFQMPG